MIDLHAHVLPGLDDGPPDLSAAIDLLRAMAQDGTTTVIASPHAFDDRFTNTGKQVIEAVDKLQQEAERQSLLVTILPGMELRLRPDLPALLRSGQALPMGRGRHVCLELPPNQLPYYTDRAIFELMVAGWIPVLNHPERNRAIQRNPALLRRLTDRGVIAMASAGSLLGQFGPLAGRLSRRCLFDGVITLVGSDAHDCGTRSPQLRAALRVVGAQVPTLQSAAQAVIMGN